MAPEINKQELRNLIATRFSSVDDQQLTLSCDHSGFDHNWCNVLEEYIQHGLDAIDLWDLIESGGAPIQVTVPYIPTADQFAVVLITDQDENGNCKMMLEVSDPPQGAGAFVGFVSPMEGRLIFRSMIHDWFMARVDYNKVCSSPQHGLGAQRIWDRDQRDRSVEGRTRRTAQLWSVYVTHKCLACGNKVNNMSDEDLIPS